MDIFVKYIELINKRSDIKMATTNYRCISYLYYQLELYID